jgi:cell fate regulator YaaT (PSP1 superfamily)
MESQEYLVSFGRTGEFGRFRAAASLGLRRGEHVVVRGPRGVEVALVLREATARHAHFLPNTSVGQLLRRRTSEDEQTERHLHSRSQQLFERGTQLVTELALPLVLVDVEILLDGEHAVLHYLGGAPCDLRPFVSTLSREFALHVTLIDLAGAPEPAEEEQAGCGRPDCGHKGEGGCDTCGSGGCGTCGAHTPRDMELHFAQLREQMERRRTALL